MAAWVSRIGPK